MVKMDASDECVTSEEEIIIVNDSECVGLKRQRSSEGWKRNVAKKLRNSDKMYISVRTGKKIPAKKFKPVESCCKKRWYHGALSRVEAENVLRVLREGSYLVRNSESARHDYSLSLKGARGFMHMRIQQNKESGKFILGQFSKPFDNIPEMIQHYTVNQLPIRGAEHMCLLHPVIEQLL